jgi:DNA repair and recombination protein RAD52
MLIMSGDEFDEADFNVAHQEHPDEVSLDISASSGDTKRASTLQILEARKISQPRPLAPRIDSVAHELRQSPSRTGAFSGAHPVRPNEAGSDVIDRPKDEESAGPKHTGRLAGSLPVAPLSRAPGNTLLDPGGVTRCLSEPRHIQEKHDDPNRLGDRIPPFVLSDTVDHAAPVGFFTARAAESVQNGSNAPVKAPAFNPHLESPSIRKTAGVDHTKTKPVGRDSIPISPSILPPRPNFINPQIDKNRRIGMPIGAASPLQNRGSYKPLQIKRPSELDPAQYVFSMQTRLLSCFVNIII